MILNKSYLGLFLIILQSLDAKAGDGIISEVPVRAYWKKILDYDNRNSVQVQQSIKWTKGLTTVPSMEGYLETIHSVGVELPKLVFEFPILFKILNLEVTYSYKRKWHSLTMSQADIYQSTEDSIWVEIPPQTRLIRWQLIADVGDHEVGYYHYLDLVTDKSPPKVEGIAKIEERKLIVHEDLFKRDESSLTRFRIKHKSTGKFLTVTQRFSWPAATLGYNSHFNFTLYCSSRGGFKIKTWNTMYSGYHMLYSSSNGGIYFDQSHNCKKQRWYPKVVGRNRDFEPGHNLYDGDVVTFRNVYYPDSFLCRYEGPSTDVYCLQDQADEWILVAY